jgi:hypothetical protein
VTTAQNSKISAKRVPGRPFERGKSGNPGGRPKTAQFAEEVRRYLKQKDGDQTNLQTVLENLKKNDPKILLYYAFGKPAETISLKDEEGKPIWLAVVERAREIAVTGRN